MDAPRGRTDEEREYYALSRKVYAIFAPFYDIVTLPVRRLRREVVDTVDLGPCSKILDVATGTGAQALAFAEKAGEVVGVDLSEAMLRIARRKSHFANVTFSQADAAELPFEDRSFDVSCISFALHEMPRSVRDRVVCEMARVTKPGGFIVVVDYALPRNVIASSLVYHIVKLYERDHYADFVRQHVPALLQGAGIEVQGQRPALFGMASILTGRRLDSSDRAPQTGGERPPL